MSEPAPVEKKKADKFDKFMKVCSPPSPTHARSASTMQTPSHHR